MLKVFKPYSIPVFPPEVAHSFATQYLQYWYVHCVCIPISLLSKPPNSHDLFIRMALIKFFERPHEAEVQAH